MVDERVLTLVSSVDNAERWVLLGNLKERGKKVFELVLDDTRMWMLFGWWYNQVDMYSQLIFQFGYLDMNITWRSCGCHLFAGIPKWNSQFSFLDFKKQWLIGFCESQQPLEWQHLHFYLEYYSYYRFQETTATWFLNDGKKGQLYETFTGSVKVGESHTFFEEY